MPHYDFRCENCGNVEEAFMSMTASDSEKIKCAKCGENMVKQLGGGLPPHISGTENKYYGS